MPRAYGGGAPWPNDPYPAAAGVPGRYAALRKVLSGELGADQVITALQDSGLRGHGRRRLPHRAGSGRWSPRRRPRPKYVICNADESEPGTFKDRQILAEQPHLVLEGLLLGMAVVGAEEGWVFIRHEYGQEEAVIRGEIESLRAAGPAAVSGRTRRAAAGGSRSRCSPRRAATSSARSRR